MNAEMIADECWQFIKLLCCIAVILTYWAVGLAMTWIILRVVYKLFLWSLS